MTVVVDASAAVLAMLSDGKARTVLGAEPVAVPHLVDAELAQALRRLAAAGRITPEEGAGALTRWSSLGLRRYAAVGLLARVWELRANVTAYDATYVALAEALGAPLVTADARLAAAPGPTCATVVVRT